MENSSSSSVIAAIETDHVDLNDPFNRQKLESLPTKRVVKEKPKPKKCVI